MILKGSQRGGANQLAAHLLKTEENEHVEVHEVRGFVSDNLSGALKEAYAVSRGTKCKQFLFSVSLNPPERERVGLDVFIAAIDAIEHKTGMQGHPRLIVFHEKEGRRHAHAVWSRIDVQTMTAKNLPFFKLKLRDISRQLYLQHEWKMPRGLMESQARDPRNFSLVEWQQAKRMGRDARAFKAMLQECWAASDSRAAFQQALAERGLTLAKGDRRGFVAVTHEGEVLSVARYIGKRAKDVRARLGDPENLPSVYAARASIAADMGAAFARHANEVSSEKDRALLALEQRRIAMAAKHREERKLLDRGQRHRWEEEARERAALFKTGLRGLWQKLTGSIAAIQKRCEEDAYAALQRDRGQRQALVDAQLDERQGLQWEIRRSRSAYARTLQEIRTDRRALLGRFADASTTGEISLSRRSRRNHRQSDKQNFGLDPQ